MMTRQVIATSLAALTICSCASYEEHNYSNSRDIDYSLSRDPIMPEISILIINNKSDFYVCVSDYDISAISETLTNYQKNNRNNAPPPKYISGIPYNEGLRVIEPHGKSEIYIQSSTDFQMVHGFQLRAIDCKKLLGKSVFRIVNSDYVTKSEQSPITDN